MNLLEKLSKIFKILRKKELDSKPGIMPKITVILCESPEK